MNVFCGTCGLPFSDNIHKHGTYSKLFNRSAPEGAHPFDRVRKEIHELINRGNITVKESESIACNSWEREAMVPALTDEAFVGQMEYCLKNCTVTERPHTTYDQAIVGLWAPELVKRFMRALSDGLEAGSFAHVLDQIRAALGQDGTHYLVMADDVRALVQAVEKDNADAMTVLEQIRREPGSGTSKRKEKSSKCSKCGNGLATLCRNGVLLCYDCMAKDLEARPLTEFCSLHGPFDSSGGYCPECVSEAATKKFVQVMVDAPPIYENSLSKHVFPELFDLKPSPNDLEALKAFDADFGPGKRFERTPDGHINNCSIANGEPETGCQICRGNCPDRKKFK